MRTDMVTGKKGGRHFSALLLVLIACLLPLSDVAARNFQIIPRVGVNMASMSRPKSDWGWYADMRPGIVAGVSLEFPSTSFLSFEPGIYFSMQGGQSDDASLRCDYINIPLNAKVYLYRGLHLLVGPQVGFLVYEGSDEGKHVDSLCRTVDLGVNFGLGYQFDFGLNVTMGYYACVINALEDVYDASDSAKMKKLSSYKRMLQMTVGWSF